MSYRKPLILSLTALLGLAGCDNDNNSALAPPVGQNLVVVATVAPDFSGSDTQIIDLDNDFATTGGLTPRDQSDYTLARFGAHFYPIGRFNIDTVARHALDDPMTRIYEYSTLDSAEDPTSNPQNLVFVSDSKAYLMRRESAQVWIVNPSASSEGGFKLGELDLSAYSDADGGPEPIDGVIVDGRLYVLMQRLVNNAPDDEATDAYIAVFDIGTDGEIDTRPEDNASDLPGIRLSVRNPVHMKHQNGVGILISALGDPFASFRGEEREYTGGIERVDPADFSTTLIVDDGPTAADEGEHPYGSIDNLAIVDAETAYFSGLASFGNESLFKFNPLSGEVQGVVDGFNSLDIAVLTVGPQANLWVGIADAADPRIELLDAMQQPVRRVSLNQNPDAIGFAR